jgi:hypothetical protein
MHNLSLSQQEGTFSPGDSWWTCAGPRIRCNRLLDGDLLPWRVSLEGSERRAAFRSPPVIIDKVILQTLNQTQFASVRELAKSMCISRTIVWQRLTGSLWFSVKHLHCPRYPLDRCATIKSNRSVKQISQNLRVCISQWLAKFYGLGCVLVLFMDKPRKSLCSSRSATPEMMKHMIAQSIH